MDSFAPWTRHVEVGAVGPGSQLTGALAGLAAAGLAGDEVSTQAEARGVTRRGLFE